METTKNRSEFYETLTREKALQLAGGLLDEDTTKEQYNDAWVWIYDDIEKGATYPRWYIVQSYFKQQSGEINV